MAVTSSYDHLFKLLLIGDSGVGKSSILLRYIDDSFDDKQLSTIGVDFKVKYLTIGGKKVKMAIWDTAGQERFRTLTSSYYRGAQGIILVYDTSTRASFDHLTSWLDEVRRYSTHVEAVKMVIANKVDKKCQEVTRQDGERFAFQHSMLFIETSAKTRQGINHAFDEVIQKILDTPSLVTSSSQAGNIHVRQTDEGDEDGFLGGCSC